MVIFTVSYEACDLSPTTLIVQNDNLYGIKLYQTPSTHDVL